MALLRCVIAGHYCRALLQGIFAGHFCRALLQGPAKICTLSCTLCLLYRPERGNIVGRKYIKFMCPYGTFIADLPIALKKAIGI
jgi:hypothetical protein